MWIAANSQKFKTITELTQIMKKLYNAELENTKQTITVSKHEILNPLILEIEDLKQIISEEKINVTNLFDVSKFKTAQKNNVIVN